MKQTETNCKLKSFRDAIGKCGTCGTPTFSYLLFLWHFRLIRLISAKYMTDLQRDLYQQIRHDIIRRL